MKQPSVYLKMRVLGAVDTVAGRTRQERIHNVAALTFLDEQGNPRQFTGRTIQTWFYRYKNHGITGMTPQTRSDKGQARKTTPEELLESFSTPPNPTSTTGVPTNAPSIASASKTDSCSPSASPRPPSTASCASTICSLPTTPTTSNDSPSA